ncbi:calcium-binding protein [Microcoleus sp. bin38.metabat.b11b12b14.051]|uniref:calcium-binding protein n=1 Tax=Microcoleus sp. bin38.metabat.b11b12b14.051 TaxID=2742709 RepID=UPI0025EC0394|nr:calcium-binding protein [Microcoleus sp. bin38.metabat.b11b12b14.051]
MPDNLALLEKTEDFLNGNTGNEFISDRSGGDIGRSSSQVSDGRALRLSESGDLFTATPDQSGQYIQGILGLGGNDTLQGSVAEDFLNGNAGNDFISGRAGDDLLSGGIGADTIAGDEGDDVISGGEGNDLLRGGAGIDALNGNQGEDTLFGNEDNDVLQGGRGNDLLDGGAGNDLLIGDFGIDTLTGGPGNDTFVLRSNTATSVVSEADILTDFNKSEDFIGIDLDLAEADLLLQPTVANNRSSTIIRVAATNSVLGVVQGATPDDLRGRFVNLDANPALPEETVTYEAPVVRSTGSNTYDFILNGSDGSQYVVNIKRSSDEISARELRYQPGPQSSMPAHTLNMSADGKRMEAQVQGSTSKSIFDRQDDGSIVAKRKDGAGREETIATVVGPSDPSIPTTPTTPAAPTSITPCELFKGLCELSQKNNVSDNLALGGLFAVGVGTVAAPATLGTSALIGATVGGALEIAAAGVKVFDTVCLVLNGNDGAIAEKAFGLIPFGKLLAKGSALGNAARPLQAGVLKVTRKAINFVTERSELAGNVVKTYGKIAANDLFGQVGGAAKNIAYNFTSKLYDKVANTVGFSKGDGMKTLRKSLGLDFCDQPSTTPVTPPPTPSTPFLKIEVKPSAIPYQGTANLNVKYSNPDNNSKNIEISGSGRKGIGNPTFLIPENKKGQGEFNFTLTNIGTELGGPGSASLKNFLDVSIGTGGGGQLFDTVNYRQQSFDLLAAPNGANNILPNVYTLSSADGLMRR